MSNGTAISNIFFTVMRGDKSLRLPYFSSHSIENTNDDIELLVIAMHGSGEPIAEEYLDRVQDAAAMVPNATSRTLIVAPQLVAFNHLENFYGNGNVPTDIMFAGHSRFNGGLSRNTTVRISFFTAIDQLLERIVNSDNLPNLRRVVLVGHSAGGQFVNRYAASTPVQCLGLSFRYIVLNPSHYLYFSNERWIPGTSYDFSVPGTEIRDSISECSSNHNAFEDYNDYYYGLDDLWRYHDRRGITPDIMRKRYEIRNIIHLVGENDNNPNAPGLSRSCMAMLQGRNRRERGEIYSAYLTHTFGNRANHRFEVVPVAGHSGRQMITSAIGRQFIFEEFDFTTMKTLADYILMRDSSFSLRAGENREFELELPDDTVGSGFSKRPVLAFFADPSGDARNLRLTASMNGTEIFSYPYSGGVGRAHWEAFTHDHLRIGTSNRIRFAVASGSGTMHISDVILWYQRNVC